MSGELREYDEPPPRKITKGHIDLHNQVILNAWNKTADTDPVAVALLQDQENLTLIESTMADIGFEGWKSKWQVSAFHFIDTT